MSEREQVILDRLDQQGACSYQELAGWLKVSTMTVRRDVDELVRQGKLIKTLGGAQKANAPSSLYETALYARLADQRPEKRAIAARALELIGARHTVALDGSTTCLELARLIVTRSRGLTVVTNSALACLDLGPNRRNTIIGLGGEYDADSVCFVGPSAEEAAGKYFVDLAFLSTKGFIATEGTFESAVATFRIKQIIARQARRVVLLVDHTKFGQRALAKVLPVSQIHVVVTDDQAPAKDIEQLQHAGIEVHIAGSPQREGVTDVP